MRVPQLLTVSLLAGILACDSATPPERPAPYDYAIRLRGGPVLSFRWPEGSLPVRIWVQPGTDLRHTIEGAIQEWEAVALYREFTGVIVEDTAGADVLIRLGEPLGTSSASLPNCGGSTFISVELDTTITLPFIVYLNPRGGVAASDVSRCMSLVATHELGHTLGLFLHSDDPDDLMNASPNPGGLSQRDRATFNTLYHSAATVGLPPGR